ncbi:MAG TPA: hypothetical protein VGO11_14135 [Chthoniobacteraceae bacterium]|nr:hypothetical protein [Chthoniobacteraceae bacterium]
MLSRRLVLLLCLPVFGTGCATRETIPNVRARNVNSIKVGAVRRHGPETLLGSSSEPDVPSGVSIGVQRMHALYNQEPRYFIPASGELQVVSLERAARYNTKWHDFEEDVRGWKALLAADRLPSALRQAGQQLTEIPWMNAAHVFLAKPRRRTYPWGKAILFLTTYVQGSTGAPVNNDTLVLVAQGITNDGRYAVNGRFEIRHPKLPVSTYTGRASGKVYFMKDDEYRTGRAGRWLNAQSDDSFEPTFGEYDGFLAGLRISPPLSRQVLTPGSSR